MKKNILFISAGVLVVLAQVFVFVNKMPVAVMLIGCAALCLFFYYAQIGLKSISFNKPLDFIRPVIAILGVIAAGMALYKLKQNQFLGFWLFVLSGLFLAFSRKPYETGETDSEIKKLTIIEIALFVILVAFAAATRFYKLSDFPSGAAGHEGEMVAECQTLDKYPKYVAHIQNGDINWPSLIFYQGIASARVFGWTGGSFRIPAAVWGLLSIIAMYFFLRKFTSVYSAFAFSLMYASSFQHMVNSRWFFPGIILVTAPVLGFYFLITAAERKSSILYIIGGLASGLAIHGYYPGRDVPLIFIIWFIMAMIFWKKYGISLKHMSIFWIGFIVSAGPVIYYALKYPEYYWNYFQHANPNRGAGIMGYIKTISNVIPDYAKMFHFSADLDYSTHIVGTPVLEPVMRYFFPLGFFMAVFIFFRPIPAFALLLFFAGMFPAFLGGAGFAHPTTRRIIMAIPALYIFGALAMEQLSAALNPQKNKIFNFVFGFILILFAFWTANDTVNHYFVKFDKDPGARVGRGYFVYLAGKEIRQNKETVNFLSPSLTAYSITPMLIDIDAKWENKVFSEEMLVMSEDKDHLLLMEGIMAPASGWFKSVFKNADIKIYEETDQENKLFTEPSYSYKMAPWVRHNEPMNEFTYLFRVKIPKQDIVDFHSFLVKEGFIKNTQQSFEIYKGKILNIKFAVILPDGVNTFSVKTKWHGWTMKLNGLQTAVNAKIKPAAGINFIELSGIVPSTVNSGSPFIIEADGGDMFAANRVVAIGEQHGFEASFTNGYWPSVFNPVKKRMEFFPANRYHDPTILPLPFTVEYKGYITFPEAGKYEITGPQYSDCIVYLAGKMVYDSRNKRENPFKMSVNVNKGQKVQIKAMQAIGGEQLSVRAFSLYYYKEGMKRKMSVPVEWTNPY